MAYFRLHGPAVRLKATVAQKIRCVCIFQIPIMITHVYIAGYTIQYAKKHAKKNSKKNASGNANKKKKNGRTKAGGHSSPRPLNLPPQSADGLLAIAKYVASPIVFVGRH